jgi:dihydrofolate reductase
MSEVRVHNFAISLDGFGTGDGQSLEAPFGHAGERLHDWLVATKFFKAADGESGGTVGVDNAFAEQHDPGIGVEIMGAGKFGPPGWQDDPEWKGWWGPNPPFHTPTFVLTHRPRPPIEMEGGTTFHFLDASPAEALQIAREAAGGQDVRIGGGPTVVRDFVAAGLVDHMHPRSGSDRARSRGPGVGRPGGARERLRRGGGLDTQRRHPPDLHGQAPVSAKATEPQAATGTVLRHTPPD